MRQTIFVLSALLACQLGHAVSLTEDCSADYDYRPMQHLQGLTQTDRCDECTCECPAVTECSCPVLQDCGIVIPNNTLGFGSALFSKGESTVLGSSAQEIVPDMLTNSATATNVCGLEVSANKICGDTYKMKQFDICGCITVCEHECTSGCEGSRHCTDGRYSTTAQRFT